jgi:hypothetical protein
MRTPGTTLQQLKSNPDNFKGWGGITLVTNLFDYDEVKSICENENINAIILIRISEQDTVPYEQVPKKWKKLVKYIIKKEQNKK